MSSEQSIVSKVWNFCNVLRDDGVSYGDYLEQLTYLIFLKMADEASKPPCNRKINIPTGYGWSNLQNKRGAALEEHYAKTLRELARAQGILGQIFAESQNKIQDPAKLSRVVNMVDKEEWIIMGVDTKSTIYEGLLEKNAEDTSGAGQYFTPRELIRVIVECVRPKPKKTISDPACGTGGFFLAAYDYIIQNNNQLDSAQTRFLKNKTFHGNEIVANTRRLALMNMFLHNIGEIDGETLISSADSLMSDEGKRFDYVLTNPPFGNKSSMTFTNHEGKQKKEELTYNRQDFWATTSNKQLNFLQHIRTLLKTSGEAAVVLPDNVLFERGAGEAVRRELLKTTELHTILRLPTGIFYSQGVKANVLFFDNKPASKDPWTKEVWIYDYRTNIHRTLKKKPLRFSDLKDFISCYKPDNRNNRKQTWSEKNPEGRWRKFTYEEILEQNKTNLDISWLQDKKLTGLDNLPDPEILVGEIIKDMESGLESFRKILRRLA